MPSLMPNGKQQYFFPGTTAPLIGGKLYTYAAGTSTPKPTYQDAAGTTPNTNPVTLDPTGSALIYWSGNYKIVLKDALGNTVYTVDNYNTDLAAALQSILAGSSGASEIGFGQRTVEDHLHDFPTLKTFGAAGDGITDDTAAVQAAIDHGGYISAKAGTYLVSTLDFKGRSVMLIGDGEDKTIFKAAAAAVMFDVQETADQALLPLTLMFLKLVGNNKATAGIKTRYRHKTVFSNVTIEGVNGDALNELDSWNNQRINLTLDNNLAGYVLQGANNNCLFTGISASGNTSRQLDIQNGGTAGGGSAALSFSQCDFEYASGDGVRINTHGVVRFNDCYIGEQIQGNVFDMVAGMAVMSGGFAYFGTTATSYLGNLGGGKLYFKNVNITGGAAATVSNLFNAGAGRAYIEDSPCFVTVTGTQVLNGDVLDYGRTYECFAPKLGRKFDSFTLNGTNTATTTDDELTVTCTSVSGAPCIMEVRAPVTDAWLRNQPGSFVIVYSSNKDLTARLTNGSVGITPAINIGTLPSTGGVTKTAVIFSWVYHSNDTGQDMTQLEIFQLNTAVGDSFTVDEVFLYDFKQGKADSAATFYNLGKA